LAAERALGTLDDDDLVAFGSGPGPFAGDGECVLFDGQVDGVGVEAGDIEVHQERVPAAVRVHRHLPGSGRLGELCGHPVELTERIKSHQHLAASLLTLEHWPIGRRSGISTHPTPATQY
jgi:hypothetical protein